MNCLHEEFVLVEFELFVYKDADKVLDEKGLFQEVKPILRDIKRVGHREIQAEFYNKGWRLEQRIFTSPLSSI